MELLTPFIHFINFKFGKLEKRFSKNYFQSNIEKKILENVIDFLLLLESQFFFRNKLLAQQNNNDNDTLKFFPTKKCTL